MKTSERILEQARHLFNAHGVSAVSTANLAESLNISPGNLYYHFNNKQDLLVQLCEQCHQRLRPILAMLSIGQASWQELQLQLTHLLEIIAHYVFIVQDGLQICRLSIKLRHRLQWMRQQLHDAFNDLLSGYVEHGLLPTTLDIQQTAAQMSQHCWFVFVDQALQHDAALKQQQMDIPIACQQLLAPITSFIQPG